MSFKSNQNQNQNPPFSPGVLTLIGPLHHTLSVDMFFFFSNSVFNNVHNHVVFIITLIFVLRFFNVLCLFYVTLGGLENVYNNINNNSNYYYGCCCIQNDKMWNNWR